MKRAHLRLFFLLEVFLLHLLLFSSSSSSSFASSAENKDDEKKRPSFPALSSLFSGEEDNERVSDDSLFFFGGEKEGESSLAKKKFSHHRERDDDSFKPILSKEEKSRGVLIVCSEFAGLVPNGGIGTFYTSLANVLSSKEDEEGKEERFFNVTLVYTQGRKVHGKIHKKLRDEEDDDDKRRRRRAEDPFTQWQEYYKDRLNVNLVPLPPHRVSGITYHAATSYAVLDWILLEQAKTNKPFDVIHFADWQGVGYYSLLHKKSGLGLKNSLLMVMTHGPLLWARKANEEKIESVEDLESHFLEMKSVELADVVVSPSEYLLDWMEGEAGWTLAENAFVQPYVLPVEAKEAVREALDVEKYVRDRLGHTSIGEGGGGGGAVLLLLLFAVVFFSAQKETKASCSFALKSPTTSSAALRLSFAERSWSNARR
mmetsp:Transcript_970/g.3589  ORF Transcript_970/g.3589 Transcript_970/m.3589 type:complete len:428 (+) Transcript_970:137-1420(+)